MDVCAEFYTRIEDFVADILDGYIPQKTGEKTIHDPIWGSVLYYGWEIELIDSPVFQRLRDIQQLGRADLTYPAARHTRFEHSLGTVAIASRMIDNLKTRSNDYIISDSDKNKIRLAALLHDIGHCFYSHLSERIYSKMPQFKAIRKELMLNFDKGVNPKPHELFSYMLVKSETFGNFFFKYISYDVNFKRSFQSKFNLGLPVVNICAFGYLSNIVGIASNNRCNPFIGYWH